MCLPLSGTPVHATDFSRVLLSVETMLLEGISSLSQWISEFQGLKQVWDSQLQDFFFSFSFLFYLQYCGGKYIKEDFTY